MNKKCEEPIDKLTVQVRLLYHHPNFNYCILFVSMMVIRTDDRRTDRLRDNLITRCLSGPFRLGA